MKRALVWIRRDLRTRDHVAWAAATAEAQEVAVVFVFDTKILDDLPDHDDRRLSFIRGSLDEVDAKLRRAGSALLTRHGDPIELIPRLAHELGVEAVFTNGDVDPYALRRDAEVSRKLKAEGRSLKTFKDHVLFAPNEILSPEGEPYVLHRAYAEAAFARLDSTRDLAVHDPDLRRSMPLESLRGYVQSHSLPEIGFAPTALWLDPGEDAAYARLERFMVERLGEYADARHIPAVPGVSGLSVHLRHGTLSIREAARQGYERMRPHRVRDGGEKWLKELVWREYYHMILAKFPHVADEAFDPAFRGIDYPGTEGEYAAWERAETGYPIVDAAMRQLAQTGYMHNRLRMIVASFLCRDLLIDFRRGEAHFARWLLDFDLASNSGGWQWAASVGSDPQPYFGVINPLAQARKFDPDGEFVRQWIPELAVLDAVSIHAPWESPLALTGQGIVLGRDYPNPIVDHEGRRDRAIALLRSARERDTRV